MSDETLLRVIVGSVAVHQTRQLVADAEGNPIPNEHGAEQYVVPADHWASYGEVVGVGPNEAQRLRAVKTADGSPVVEDAPEGAEAGEVVGEAPEAPPPGQVVADDAAESAEPSAAAEAAGQTVQGTITQVQEYARAHPDELEQLHDAESAGQARPTLLRWLEERLGSA